MFKLLVVGESGVGKTCMLLRFADDNFEENFLSTIGVDFKVKLITVNDKKVKLQIWDSAGQERFRNITASYYRNCSAIIIVFDITNHDSYDKVSDWIEEVRRFVPNAPLLLVGNKCDLEEKRQVSYDEGMALAEKMGLLYIETSAKTAHNIEETFVQMSKKLIAESLNKPKTDSIAKPINLDEGNKSGKNKKKCCK